MKELPKTKSFRLKNYNYRSNGYYFITINTYNKEHILSDICRDYSVKLSPIGKIVEENLLKLNRKHTYIINHVIMPNHIHFIIKMENSEKSLLEIIKNYKRFTARTIKKEYEIELWDYSYYERIIRDEEELYNVRSYIESNPYRWKEGIV